MPCRLKQTRKLTSGAEGGTTSGPQQAKTLGRKPARNIWEEKEVWKAECRRRVGTGEKGVRGSRGGWWGLDMEDRVLVVLIVRDTIADQAKSTQGA